MPLLLRLRGEATLLPSTYTVARSRRLVAPWLARRGERAERARCRGGIGFIPLAYGTCVAVRSGGALSTAEGRLFTTLSEASRTQWVGTHAKVTIALTG